MKAFNKVFGIGLPCTGTAELAVALDAHGIPTVQWPRRMLDILQARAAVDITVACRFAELDSIFPGSLFIYTGRRSPDWIAAISNRYRALGPELHLPAGEREFALEADIRMFGTPSPLNADFGAAYARHEASVDRYFGARRAQFLRLDVHQPEWRDALEAFLEIPHRDEQLECLS